MATKRILLLSFLGLLALAVAYPALAASSQPSENNRYFVQSTRNLWKGTLGVRHSFEDGFTADLSDWQLRLAKLAGLKIYPVKKLNILALEVSPLPASEDIGEVFGPSEVLQTDDKAPKEEKESSDVSGRRLHAPVDRPTPSAQVPWGVKMVYNNPLLTQPVGGEGVKVAILDTGITASHPDLKNRLSGCKDFTQAKSPIINGKCDDGNGHGTHVAGIIAGDGGDDGLGIYGIAPQTHILAYKVCGNSGTCWSDDIATAIRDAANSGAQVLNLSLGSDSPSSLIIDAVNYAVSKGVLIVAAAGNDGPYEESVDYPGALAEVIAVAAVDGGRNVPDWSSRGANASTTGGIIEEGDLELAGPGVNVESTWKDGGYAISSGTSMAAPHISGLAAKLWDFEIDDPALKVREKLTSMANDVFPEGEDDASGYGIPGL